MRKYLGSLFSPPPSIGGRIHKRNFVKLQQWQHSEDIETVTDVYHYTVTTSDDDTSTTITNKLNEIISRHTDSLIFLTQKSRILRKSDDNPNYYVPLSHEEISNNDLLIEWVKKRWLRPDGGHVSMAITDNQGKILENSTVSLRPGQKRLLSGRTTLHPGLYAPGPSYVSDSIHTSIPQEVNTLAIKMTRDPKILADLTIIPLAHSKVELNTLLENIRSARAQKLYSLCSLIVKDSDINNINSEELKSRVKQLKTIAESIEEFQSIELAENESVLAAMACTQGVVQGCLGDPHQADTEIFPDQDTQTIVVYCTIALTGANRFAKFAKSINFLDAASEKTKLKQ